MCFFAKLCTTLCFTQYASKKAECVLKVKGLGGCFFNPGGTDSMDKLRQEDMAIFLNDYFYFTKLKKSTKLFGV